MMTTGEVDPQELGQWDCSKTRSGGCLGRPRRHPGRKRHPEKRPLLKDAGEKNALKPERWPKKGAKADPGKKKKTPAPADGSSAREKALAQVRAAQGTVVTEDRAELIRQAMKIRKAKQQILADLSDDQRARLAALAIRGLLNEGRDEPKN